MNHNQTDQSSASTPSCPPRDQTTRTDCFELTASPTMLRTGATGNPTYDYAIEELQRLLGRLNINPRLQDDSPRSANASNGWRLSLCKGEPSTPDRVEDDLPSGDGYRLTVETGVVRIDAATPKGILNGVYDLAERLGFVFLLPEEAGEWPPSDGVPRSLPCGRWMMQPRFSHLGVFSDLNVCKDYPHEEWLRFYAKLRFNAVTTKPETIPLCRKLGLRPEVGGHGLSALLPRERFEQEPELFRMFQPEDFNGKRMADANPCVGNLDAKRVLQENFGAFLKTVPGAHAVHAWGVDLPAGGWCLCPLCRALNASDQSMLAMRYLAETTAATPDGPRVAVIAYNDTLFPGPQVDASPQCFLLFAPRERCYAHALDDPDCPRNREHYKALKEWEDKFKGIDDAHTFEYYFDQILFRGMYPFLPAVVLEDMRVYADHGIECHMSLQVAGPAIAPEFNMLVFALGGWDRELRPDAAIATLAERIHPQAPDVWKKYLSERQRIYADVLRFCRHAMDGWMDYRFLPETTHPFGEEMAATYARTSDELDQAADGLETACQESAPGRVRELARKECGRARFEAAELRVMHHQQSAVNALAQFINTQDQKDVRHGVDQLERAIAQLDLAASLAADFGLTDRSWYRRNINGWLKREFNAKADNYRKALRP